MNAHLKLIDHDETAKPASVSTASAAIAAIKEEMDAYAARVTDKRATIKERRQAKRDVKAEYQKRIAEFNADLESDGDELDQINACYDILTKACVDLDAATMAAPKPARKRTRKAVK